MGLLMSDIVCCDMILSGPYAIVFMVARCVGLLAQIRGRPRLSTGCSRTMNFLGIERS